MKVAIVYVQLNCCKARNDDFIFARYVMLCSSIVVKFEGKKRFPF